MLSNNAVICRSSSTTKSQNTSLSRISNDQSKIKPKVQQPKISNFQPSKIQEPVPTRIIGIGTHHPDAYRLYKDRAIHIPRPKTIQMPYKTKGLSLDQQLNVLNINMCCKDTESLLPPNKDVKSPLRSEISFNSKAKDRWLLVLALLFRDELEFCCTWNGCPAACGGAELPLLLYVTTLWMLMVGWGLTGRKGWLCGSSDPIAVVDEFVDSLTIFDLPSIGLAGICGSPYQLWLSDGIWNAVEALLDGLVLSALKDEREFDLKPNSSKSGPPALGSSVQTSPPDHLTADLESCKVNDPLSPPRPPRIPDSLCGGLLENTLDASKLKEVNDSLSSITGLKSSRNHATLYRAMSGVVSQLGSECTPDSNSRDVVLCSKDQSGLDLGLDLHLTMDSPMSDSENSVNSQTGLVFVCLDATLQILAYQLVPPIFEILCCGIDADPLGFLVGGEAFWPISEEDRIAALGLVGAPITLDPHPPGDAVPKLESSVPLLPPVSEQASGPVSYPAGPHDLAVDLVNTPPSISRIIMKYSLDTSYQLGHGSSSPKGLSTTSSTDSYLDTPEVSYLGPKVAPSQQDSWQPVKSRRNWKSAFKNTKGWFDPPAILFWVEFWPELDGVRWTF
ncbi:hypothetical protein Nepgr_006547 [Nepenthes gracilis]|uniref:Uncharacterized protein n=1 Tax=Nepenthes gracilis TaxID=150966 RepID=A0AAD3XHF5_NEPGR|nr:hypothetical protein Nepgr_006547 [Nepenthes gracilis]